MDFSFLPSRVSVANLHFNKFTLPTFFVIAGCNGAGKTTASYTLLPEVLGITEFVNADEIARGLSPFNPESVAIEAGRLMLKRIHDLIDRRADFAIETTLSTRSYKQLFLDAIAKGYVVQFIFVWLASPQIAFERVQERVKHGGHFIPYDVLERRYHRGVQNFFNRYMQLGDWRILNNTNENPAVVAIAQGAEIIIFDQATFDEIKQISTGTQNG